MLSTTDGSWRRLIGTACIAVAFSTGASAADAYRLDEPIDDTRVYGVGFRVDISGSLLTVGDDNKQSPLDLRAAAAISYRERRVIGPGRDAEALRALRDYEVSNSDISVDGSKLPARRLDDQHKLTVAQGRAHGVDVYSLAGPLSADELDMLLVPCDSLILTRLLPAEEVKVGEAWKPESWVLQSLTSLEAASSSECECKLASVDGDTAKIDVVGKIDGAVNGAIAKLSINGTIDYSLDKKCVTAWDLTQREERSVGAVSPGLNLTARVRALRAPAKALGRLGDEALAERAAQDVPVESTLVRFTSQWNMSLLHSRDWHIFKQSERLAILRLLDQGSLVAQCEFSPAEPVKPGDHTPVSQFREDIKRSLGQLIKSIESPEESRDKGGRYVCRVVVRGTNKDVPIVWIHYLVADKSGRQASLVFTVDAALREKLGDRDRELLGTLQIGPEPKARPTPTPR